MAASFWITMKVLDYWDSKVVNPTQIHVTEATFGRNCGGLKGPAGVYEVKSGNATVTVSEACNNAKGTCEFVVDLIKIGDPAPFCGKEFTVDYRCGASRTYPPSQSCGCSRRQKACPQLSSAVAVG